MAGKQIWKVYIHVHIQSFLSIHSGCLVFIGYNAGKIDQYDTRISSIVIGNLIHSDQGIRHAADIS